MRQLNTLLWATMLMSVFVAKAQNPWEKYGYTPPKALTLSDGKYQEFFSNEDVTQIGSVMFNTKTDEVVAFVDFSKEDKDTTILRPEVISRFLSPDAHESKYPFASPYNFTLNNPINATDPDGKDVYLVVWATAKGEIGHAAIAVSNYRAVESQVIENGKTVTKTSYVPDGSFTYYDLWPGGAGAGKENFDKDVTGQYQKFDKVSWNGIFNQDPSQGEGRNPEGIVKLTTTYDQDQNVVKALDAKIAAAAPYNGLTNNCSDFAECGVEATGANVNADEVIKTGTSATTPNSLFKATEKLPNATVLRDPGDAVNNGFIEGAQGGASGKAAQKYMGGEASPERQPKK